MYEGSITLQLAQDDRWAVKTVQGPWATDLEEWFLGSTLNIKDKTFGNAGIQLQYNEGSPRGYIGDGVNAFWKFDGAKLTWKAANTELDADGNFQCTGGTIGGWTLGATTIAKGTDIILDAGANPKITINNTAYGNAGIQLEYNGGFSRGYIGDGVNAFWKFDGAKLTWKAANTELDSSGNLQCTGGRIGAWYISSTSLYSVDSSIYLSANAKKITINNTTYGNKGIQLDYNSGNPRLYCGDGANAYIKFDGIKLQWKGSNSELDASGNLQCTGGHIGGWTIGATTLAIGTDIILDALNKAISINDATFGHQGIQIQYNGGNPQFYAGDGVSKWVKYENGALQLAEGEVKKVTLTDTLLLGDGSTISGTITLNIAEGQGDCYIAAGKSDFTTADAGFILGQDDSDSNKAKFYLGDANDFLYWNGSALVLSGNVLAGAITLGDGSNVSGTITLSIADGQGDCYIAAGKSDFTNVDDGFILGQDDSDSNKAKFYLGSSTDYLNWDGSTLVLSGGVLAGAITLGDGSTASGTLTLSLASGQGDCYIAAGKSSFDNVDNGFILGIEDESAEPVKFYLGNSTDYLNWDGSNLVINVASEDAIVIQSGGNIKLVSADANPGAIEFVGTDNSILLSGLDAEGCEIYLLPNSEASSEQILCGIGDYTHRWDRIYLICSIQTDIICYLDSNNYTAFQVGADTNECNVDMDCAISGTTKTIRALYDTDHSWLYLAPLSNKEWDLGQSDKAWDDAYADDWNNVADFFHLDSKDDLAVICSIKGSGIIDKRTGLELIDDKTLPEWLLAKDKNTGDVLYADGKPYISLKAAISLSWGAIRQLREEIRNGKY